MVLVTYILTLNHKLAGLYLVFGGFGAKIGLFDPDDVQADTAGFGATEGSSPRVEAQITYAGDILNTGVGINLWVDGTYQNTERTTAEINAVNNFAANHCWCFKQQLKEVLHA